MNNNPNTRSRKFSLLPKTAPSRETERYSEQEKKVKEIDKNKPTGGLKIFVESETPHTEISRSEWNNQKKPHEKKTDEKIRSKGKKEAKKKWRKNSKSLLLDWQGEVKQKANNAVQESKKTQDTKPKSPTKAVGDRVKAPVSSLFTLRKEDSAKRKPFPKQEITKPQTAFILSSQATTPKPSQKVEPSKSEVKLTLSEIKKIHINEILKGHAQKTHSSTNKTVSNEIKEYSFQGVTELLEKVQNFPKTKEPKVEKIESKIEKPKTEDGNKEIDFKEGTPEDKKKLANKWIKYPRSRELERRLQNSWQEPATTLFFYLEDNANKNKTNEEENAKKADDKTSEKIKEDEKKGEKRATYTDRLLVSRPSAGKDREEKKTEDMADQKEEKAEDKDSSAEKMSLTKKLESLLSPGNTDPTKTITMPKELSLNDNREMVLMKDARAQEGDPFFKTKSTRSTELRDLVTQAVKEHKIFCIFDNHWYIVRPVREELLNRGWLEVIPDRRLIPRRRPPPMGPTYERDKSTPDRNSNTIEAILTARETFADEIQETVSKSSSFRSSINKPKPTPATAGTLTLSKKSSSESLSEVISQFRIIPPTSEKKKNNIEIREFVTKYQTVLEKGNKKNGKEDQKNSKNNKKERKASEHSQKHAELEKEQKDQKEPETENKESENNREDSKKAHTTKSLLAIVESINENKKTLMQAVSEIKRLECKVGVKDCLGALYNADKLVPSIKSKESKDDKDKLSKSQGSTLSASKSSFSDSEAKLISKIIQSTNARIHFMWLSIKPVIHLKCFNYTPEIVNKFQKTTFCTKIGLWSHLSNIQWYAHEVHFPAKSPRMYNTGEADDLQAFFQDFQLTACIGMLKWLSDTFFDRGMKAVQTKKGKVPLKAFEFAIKQCEKYIRFKDNEDLGLVEEPKVLQEEWNTFLQWFYIITNDHGKVQESSSAQLMVVYTKAVETLRTMKRHWPEIDIDGRLNIWIMKPYCASCGRGIFMTNNVYYIGQHSKYIVQKYIEKPLLIYNTKFDIRQWFMITKLTPLEIWMYKECYLRFCTQPFALRNLHESVHLSNNSVQRKYTGFRDPSLPDQNMWDSNTFQLYLRTIGHPNAWKDIIYPGMRDAIVSTMLAAQDTFDGPRRSWFEVYGADFMLSSNLKDGPWLIEINENPAMDPSTKVTARLCPQMLRDVIKVVVDKKNNKNASTGEWELVYRQNYSPSFGTVDLDVRGKKIARVPHTVKISQNLRQSPTSIRWNLDDYGSKQLYEVVKSFESNQSKGDSEGNASSQNKSREKQFRGSKTGIKEAKTPEGWKVSRDKIQKTPQSLGQLSSNAKKTTNQKPEPNANGKSLETAENDEQKRTEGSKTEKSLVPVLSGVKKPKNLSQSREKPKTVEKGSLDSQLAIVKKKGSGTQSMLGSQNEVFKFTKFYKI